VKIDQTKPRHGLLFALGLLGLASIVYAQNPRFDASYTRAHISAIARHLRQVSARLGDRADYLSGPMRGALQFADQWGKLQARVARLSSATVGDKASAPKRFRNPISLPDLGFSRYSGFTESETSTAWCGTNLVVGFNSSASLLESGGQSYEGYIFSNDKGGTLSPRSTVVGPTNVTLLGAPVLACSDPSTFYYVGLAQDSSDTASGKSEVVIAISTDGGATFPSTRIAVAKDADFHLLDKDWFAIDSTNVPQRLYVTYTDFDFSAARGGPGNDCGTGGSNISRTAIELVRSTDGGAHWSVPTVVHEVCGEPFVQGSQVAVDPTNGRVHVAWESIASDATTREIDIAKSVDQGASFSPPTRVGSVHPAGDGNVLGLQGMIDNLEFPSLAIGKAANNQGELYLVWNDGDQPTADAVLDLIGVNGGNYDFSDILFVKSTDGGNSWSAPVLISQGGSASTPHDNFNPAIATDRTGRLAVCWYDRRRDSNNFLIDRFCGSSTDDGVTWTNARITSVNFPSLVDQDFFEPAGYNGDYDTLASDTTNAFAGLLGGFASNSAGNPRVGLNIP
jgi:hypothetical protein